MSKGEVSVLEGNFVIARFMEYDYPDMENDIWKVSADLHNYHEDWRRLMPVCIKLGMKTVSTDIKIAYNEVLEKIK